MATDTHDKVKQVLDGITDLILSNLNGVAHEEYFPQSDPDKMDHRIEEGRERAKELRRLRQEFEDCVTGIVGPVI